MIEDTREHQCTIKWVRTITQRRHLERRLVDVPLQIMWRCPERYGDNANGELERKRGETEAVNVNYGVCSRQHQYSSKFQDNNIVEPLQST